MAGYYDSNISAQMCVKCNPTCKTCLNGISCQSCDNSQNWQLNTTAIYNGSISKFCSCNYGMYYSGSPPICSSCHYSCAYCNGSTKNHCLYCDSTYYRILVPVSRSCICMDGYFDDGVYSLCLECHPFCSVCLSYSTTNCTACNSPYYYTPALISCSVSC